MGRGIVERFDLFIDRDRDHLGHARNIATDHEHDAEFPQRVGKTEHDCRYKAPCRHWRNDGDKSIERGGAQRRGGFQRCAADRLERALQWLDDKGQGIEDRGNDQAGKSECQAVAGQFDPEPSDRPRGPNKINR